jgi:hypothetical protein
MIGGAALVVAAGVGLAAATTMADEDGTKGDAAPTKPTTRVTKSAEPKKVEPKKVEPKQVEPKRPDVVPEVFVEVFNNSGITGLAASTATRLEAAGWNVASTDNWYGNIPDNTVYYPDGMRDEATKLAKVLHFDRMRPAVSPMQFDRLTVILTSA